MAKLIRDMDIRVLQQPTLFALHTGLIVKVNQSFCQLGGWKLSDLIGQSVSSIVDERLISAQHHDNLVQKYKFNHDSKIIGKSRLLPIRLANGGREFFSVQILPLGDSKSWAYLCFFSPIEHYSLSQDPKLNFLLYQKIAQSMKQQHFFEDELQALKSHPPNGQEKEPNLQSQQQKYLFVSLLKEYLSFEVFIVTKFLEENHYHSDCWKVLQDFLYYHKTQRLENIYRLFLGENDQSSDSKSNDSRTREQVTEGAKEYINTICWRVLYPSLCPKNTDVKKCFLNLTKVLLSTCETNPLKSKQTETGDDGWNRAGSNLGGSNQNRRKEDPFEPSWNSSRCCRSTSCGPDCPSRSDEVKPTSSDPNHYPDLSRSCSSGSNHSLVSDESVDSINADQMTDQRV